MKAISVLIGALLVALLLAVMPVQVNAQSPVPLQVDESGTFTNADYIIKVPVDWNGTLVVYARGYSFEVPPAAGGPPQTPGIEEALLGEGYAIAGSAYKGSGWAVKEGLQNTLALTNRFNGIVGKPGRTILYGTSMGSVIALNGIEKHPGIYDGALAACAVGAGAPRNWDGTLVLSLAYDVVFGWPESWGAIDNVRDDINFEAEVLPILGAQLSNPANIGKFEFMRLVNGLPSEGFYPPEPPPPARVPIPWLFLDMLFATQARAEVEQRAGGSPVQNLDHLYSLTDQDKLNLEILGVDADALLLEMNDRRVYDADRNARNYLEHNADYTGKLKRPVLTMHTIIDGLVPPSNEALYAETVEAASSQEYLVQTFTNNIGHCNFTVDQMTTAMNALNKWIEEGVKPTAGDFPESLGFNNGYIPARPPFYPPN